MGEEQAAERLHRDLDIVRSLSNSISEPGPPGLVILYGLPGSGKSYFAQLVAERCNAVVLNSDQNRRAIVEGALLYDGPENRRLFKALNRRVEELLDLGQVVVFDSTGLRDWIRNPLERIAQDRNLIPVRVHLDPPEEVILHRLANRQPPPDPANGAKTWHDVYEWMLPGWQPIAEHHWHLVEPASVHAAVDTVCRLLVEQP